MIESITATVFPLTLLNKIEDAKLMVDLKVADMRYNRKILQLNNEKNKNNTKTVVTESEAAERKDDENTSLIVVPDESTEGAQEVIKEDSDFTFKMFDDDDITRNMDAALTEISDNDDHKVELIILTILYMAKIIKFEQLTVRLKSDQDAVIINSICKLFSGFVVFPTYTTVDVNAVVDAKTLKRVLEFEAEYEETPDKEFVGCLLKALRNNMIKRSAEEQLAAGEKDPDPIVPIFFVNSNMDLTAPQGLNKSTVAKLETEFKDLLAMYPHQFNRLNGIVELALIRPNGIEPYYIDPGYIIGNGINVICNIPGDTIMVNIKHTDIISKFLANHNYVLSPEEINVVMQDMFTNQKIYSIVDMSKGPEFLPKLNDDEFSKLGKKLSSVCNLPWNELGLEKSRLRFRGFKSVDDFSLVSDSKCKSPIFGQVEFITAGLTIKVKDDKIIVKCNDKETEYNIEYKAS